MKGKLTKVHNIESRKNNHGITLVALVITIVIIIILSAIVINLTFGDNGLITKAQQAAEMTSVAQIQEQLEMAKGSVYIDGAGEIDPDHYFDILEKEEIINDKDTDVEDNEDGSYDVTTDGDYVFEVTPAPDGDIEIEYVGKNDEPRIRSINVTDKTENSVTVEIVTKNVDSSDGVEYTYSYKKTDDSNWTEATSGSSDNTFTCSGLENNTSYDIKVTVKLDDGTTLEKTITVKIGTGVVEVPEGAITFGTASWSGGTASITVSTNTSYQIEYKLSAPEEDTGWTGITSGGSISGLSYGATVYARLTDGVNHGAYASASIVETIAPQAATIKLSATSTKTTESITAAVTMADNESGVNITESKWVYNTNGGNIGTDEASYTNSFATNPETLTLSATSAGTYYLHVLTVDVAGNKVETISEAVTVESAAPPIEPATSYVGYYADVDGNGSVDGIIYADLAIGGSGQWTDSDGTYTIPKGSNFREYTESGTHTESGFGSKGVIKATSTSGNERFYVMALSNVDTNTHYWYYSAYGNMSDYASTTSGNFGAGEKNTETMITKWNSNAYGSQNSNDMWGLSAVQSGTWNGASGWYVPSRGEWAAFASQLDITKANYTNFGLSSNYWSSSQTNTNYAWGVIFNLGYMSGNYVTSGTYVRLGTTF